MIDFLSDEEKTKIMRFNMDKVLSEAVKKVLLHLIYNSGTLRKDAPAEPTKNAALTLALYSAGTPTYLTDEQLGQDVRAIANGVRFLELGYQELEKIKLELGETPPEENNAI